MSIIAQSMDQALRKNTHPVVKVVGVPGAGKTHQVADYLLDRAASGYAWEEMLPISFSRAAAKASRRRLAAFGAPDSALQDYRTIHSRCYRLLELGRGDTLTEAQTREFIEDMRLEHSLGDRAERLDADEGLGNLRFGRRLGDLHLLADHLWRNTMGRIPARDLLAVFPDDGSVTWSSLMSFIEAFEAFRRSKGVMDFTDMLEEVLRRELRPDVRVLVADEAQDLTDLQIAVLRMWRRGGRIRETVILGDDDQAVFTWAGANSSWFVDGIRADEVVKLERSHRVPSEIFGWADRVIRKNFRRIPKALRSVHAGGEAVVAHNPERAVELAHAMSRGDDVYLLARSRRLLDEVFRGALEDRGVPYGYMGRFAGKSVWQTRLPLAVRSLRVLRAGGAVTPAELDGVLKYVPARGVLPWGAKKRVSELARREEQPLLTADAMRRDGLAEVADALLSREPRELLTLRVSEGRLDTVLRAARLNGESVLGQEPQFALGTKHASKGLEAGTVVVLETEDTAGNEPRTEAERRVVYVARTRAARNLVVVPMEASAR